MKLAIPIEREVARLDPNLAVSDVLTMDQLIAKRTAKQHFSLLLVVSLTASLIPALGTTAIDPAQTLRAK